jgi:DNA-directed RNA polymerase subunit RPC12/RpoP
MGINQSLNELVFELNKLVESKILKAEPLCSTVACPFCDSLKNKLHLQCPKCNNVQLIKGKALEHMNCGNIDFRSKFDKGNGDNICPKCGKKINQIDVDYRKVGLLYKCSNGHIFSLPDINLKCSECGKIFDLDEAVIKILYQYMLIEAKQNWIRLGPLKDNTLEENKKPEHKDNNTLNIKEIAKRLLQ